MERTALPRASEEVDLHRLSLGTCVLTFDWREFAQSEYIVASCNESHGAELVAKVDATDAFDVYPGDLAVSNFAIEVCDSVERFAVHLRDEVAADYPNAVMREVVPSSAVWATGNPFVYCFVVNTDGVPLTRQFYTADTFN